METELTNKDILTIYGILKRIDLRHARTETKLAVIKAASELRPRTDTLTKKLEEIRRGCYPESLSRRILEYNAAARRYKESKTDEARDALEGMRDVAEEAREAEDLQEKLSEELMGESERLEMPSMEAFPLLEAVDKSGIPYNAEDGESLMKLCNLTKTTEI